MMGKSAQAMKRPSAVNVYKNVLKTPDSPLICHAAIIQTGGIKDVY
jgi:hypothetical protein